MADKTIIMNKNDVNNPLHPNLWYEWLETLGVDSGAEDVCLELSSSDDNKKSE